MEAYTSFARVYDIFMDNVPYKEWADYLGKILKEYGIDDGLVLDLGCGTGSMTEMLASSGYDMIGVDNAEEMLEIAMEKRIESGHDILYLLQNLNCLLRSSRFHHHFLETALKCTIFLDVLAILIESGCTYALYLTARKSRLQQIGCIH